MKYAKYVFVAFVLLVIYSLFDLFWRDFLIGWAANQGFMYGEAAFQSALSTMKTALTVVNVWTLWLTTILGILLFKK